jgi:MFS family permease
VKKGHLFYGYWILSAASLICMITVLASLNSFSVFVKPLQSALGWGRAPIMAGFTVMLALLGLTSPFAGRLLDRYGARKVMTSGVLIIITGLIVLSRMTSLSQFYLGCALVGVGSTASGPVGSSYLVSHWFKRQRGMAVGILSGGMSLSGILLVPVMAVYVLPAFGWRATYFMIAVLCAAVLIPLLFFIVRTKPADIGLFPDGVEGRKSSDEAENGGSIPIRGVSPRMALATSAFWFLAFSLVLNHTHLGILQSIFPHLSDLGFPIGTVASVTGLTSGTISVSMFLFGWLCDRIAPKYAATIGLAGVAFGIALLLFIGPSSSLPSLFFYAVVFGLGIGSWMPTMSMLTSRTFGMASYGSIFGMMSFFQCAGGAMGPLLAGYSFDVHHSYQWGFIVILIFVVAAIPLVLAVPKHPITHERAERRSSKAH